MDRLIRKMSKYLSIMELTEWQLPGRERNLSSCSVLVWGFGHTQACQVCQRSSFLTLRMSEVRVTRGLCNFVTGTGLPRLARDLERSSRGTCLRASAQKELERILFTSIRYVYKSLHKPLWLSFSRISPTLYDLTLYLSICPSLHVVRY
jgi:hypothetical protein